LTAIIIQAGMDLIFGATVLYSQTICAFPYIPLASEQSKSTIIYTRSKKFSPKNKKNLGMACRIPPLKKAKKQGEMQLPSLGPIPLKKCRI